MTMNKHQFIWLGPLLAIVFYVGLSACGIEQKAALTAGITLLTVIWWVTEALPIPATSLVPFALLPLFGIIDHKTAASALGSHVILLLMAAFMLSKALEKSGAHQRLAVYIVKLIGTHSGKRLVLGFMLAAGLLSMWISNTATTLIMIPMALAILTHVDNDKLKIALILGIAYASSLGGIGTPIGTPPNVIFMAVYEEHTGQEFSFLDWMMIGVPIVLVALPLMALWLTRNVHLQQEITLPELGAWRVEEKRTVLIFGLTALAWVTRTAPFGGWSDALGLQMVGDSTVAFVAAVIMFMTSNGKGGRILDWNTASNIPWGILLLFAGGIAIAKGFSASGLSTLFSNGLMALSTLPAIVMILVTCLFVTYLTEITSNTATATLLMPILAVAATASHHDPALLMIPAAMCASCAFMLPVSTAPNAIAFGTGQVSIQTMAREGVVLSFIVSCLIAVGCYLLLL